MELTGTALLLHRRPLGERDAVLTLLCPQHGLISGMVRGGAGCNPKRAVPQVLDDVAYTHVRRLEGQLGTMRHETTHSRAHLWLAGRAGTLVAAWLTELLIRLLPEHHPYPELHPLLLHFLATFATTAPSQLCGQVAELELALLHTIGYGPALNADPVPCPHGTPLTWVSPASGRAVPAGVGAPYAHRLLPLPTCWGGTACPTAALTVTGHFLALALHHKKLAARPQLVEYLTHEALPHIPLARAA